MYIVWSVGQMNFKEVMTLYIVRQIFLTVLTSHAFFWAYCGLSLLGLGSV